MTLGSAWSVGLSGLSTSSDQMSLVSRNVSRAGDPNASRKVGEQVTLLGGSAKVASIQRVSDPVLLDGALTSISALSREASMMSHLDQLYGAMLDPELATSPAALVADLETQIRLSANDPSNRSAALQVVSSAASLASALNDATALISSVRSQADGEIATAVSDLNGLLDSLSTVNKEIVTATPSKSDVTDQLDRRDEILKSISEIVGIKVVPRDGNDIIVYTDGGVVLFEKTPRAVSFTRTGYLGPSSMAGSISIDGVDVTGSDALMPSRTGSIVGLVQIRDSIAPHLQNQLDEFARVLIHTFADRDQSGSGKPDLPGLFSWSGITVPPSGILVSGIAADIRVNPQIDPAQGGDLRYLRDGGASAPLDPDYNANPDGYAGFSKRLTETLKALSSPQLFDAAAGLSQSADLKAFAAQSVGWFEELRQVSSRQIEVQSAIRDRANERLLGVTGISLDQEMADLLRFEQSYQAAGRLIATVDNMIKTIIELGR
jgi:flagellar hook-associated protein 1 FlgK